MKNTVGISHRLKRAWLDDLLDRLVQTRDEKELRAFVDQRLRDELPGKDARAKAAGILLRVWSGMEPNQVALRVRAVALLPRITGQERIWLHWGMAALAYPFFRDLAEVIGRMLTLQDDITNAQVQTRLKTAWGDRETSKEAAGKLITSMVDWEVLRATKTKGHFLLARKMTTSVADLQLWLLEAMLLASASDEIEAHQLLRLPELFPFSFTVSVGDLRRHEGFNIHRQGLDMDMVSVRQVKVEPPPQSPTKAKKPKKNEPPKQDEPTLFDEPIPQVASGPLSSIVVPSPGGGGPQGCESTGLKLYRALVIVRNLDSSTHKLDFGEFVINNIKHPQHLDLRKTLSSLDIYIGDWLLEKTYSVLPDSTGPSPSGIGGIPNDIEDILLLLRLYKVGDVVFTKQAVVKPNGESLVQHPYRFLNDLNSDSVLVTELSEGDRDPWNTFASVLRSSKSWNAPWFSVSRRFFLYGGAKEFNPTWDEVDRIVDYATALESALVPEGDFSKARCANRAATLCSSAPNEQKAIASLVKKLYDIRSSIVHGSVLNEENRTWLKENSREVELRVRQVLISTAQQTPPDDDGRTTFLQSLFDVTDEKRGEFAVQMFRQIKTEDVRSTTATQIAKLKAKRK
jgi:Apea-like HEPN